MVPIQSWPWHADELATVWGTGDKILFKKCLKVLESLCLQKNIGESWRGWIDLTQKWLLTAQRWDEKKWKIHCSNSGPQATCGPDKTLAWPSKCILRHKDISNRDVKTEVLTDPCPSYTFASLIMVLRTLCCSCHWVTKVCYLAVKWIWIMFSL